jgi:hypothetical protein
MSLPKEPRESTEKEQARFLEQYINLPLLTNESLIGKEKTTDTVEGGMFSTHVRL